MKRTVMLDSKTGLEIYDPIVSKFDFDSDKLTICISPNSAQTSNNFHLINENVTTQKSFEKYLKIELSGDISFIYEDWYSDENIPKSNIPQDGLRWNDLEEVVQYRMNRKIGEDLPDNFYSELNFEFATLLEIEPTYDAPNKLEITIDISYDYFSGPLKIYCSNASIIIE